MVRAQEPWQRAADPFDTRIRRRMREEVLVHQIGEAAFAQTIGQTPELVAQGVELAGPIGAAVDQHAIACGEPPLAEEAPLYRFRRHGRVPHRGPKQPLRGLERHPAPR